MSKVRGRRAEDTVQTLIREGSIGNRPSSKEEEIEMTPAHAHKIFENAVFSVVNDGLEAEGKDAIFLDETVIFDWVVNEEVPEGSFVILKGGIQTEEAEEYVLEENPITGEVYPQKKLPENFKPYEKMHRFYYLRTDIVKDIFDKLDPDVKKSLLDALNENLDASRSLAAKYRQELKGENVLEDRKKLEAKIFEQELGIEKINKELKALE